MPASFTREGLEAVAAAHVVVDLTGNGHDLRPFTLIEEDQIALLRARVAELERRVRAAEFAMSTYAAGLDRLVYRVEKIESKVRLL